MVKKQSEEKSIVKLLILYGNLSLPEGVSKRRLSNHWRSIFHVNFVLGVSLENLFGQIGSRFHILFILVEERLS